MKSLSSILLATIGLIAGWGLASFRASPEPKTTSSPPSDRRGQPISGAEKKLLAQLLDEYEETTLASERATTSIEVVEALRDTFNYGDDDLARIVALGPEDAFYELLRNPGASNSFCTQLAAEWARTEPTKAIHFFKDQDSFRAGDCLAAALPIAFGIHPHLVLDTISSQSLNWQRRHLEDLVTAEYLVRNPNAISPPSKPPGADPFDTAYDVNTWLSKPLGSEIIDAFEHPELRAKAAEHLSPPQEPEDLESATTKSKVTLDLASYKPSNYSLREAFRERWNEDREGMMTEIIVRGSIESRRSAMGMIVGEFPMEEQEWPGALNQLDSAIERLEVIPPHPPRHFEMGPFLQGEAPAEWITRQSPALQRAWTKTFVDTWAKNQPEMALRWTLDQPESQHRNIALQSGLVIWAHQDPQSAISFVEALPQGDLRDSAISNAAASWSRIDHHGARNWLQTLPESTARKAALDRISTQQ